MIDKFICLPNLYLKGMIKFAFKIFYTNVFFFFCKDYNNKEQQKAKVKVKETDPTWSENWLFPAAF